MANVEIETYSKRNGEKRKPQQLYPAVIYDESMDFVTDKLAELYFIQHKQMREFLARKGLLDEFNAFQKDKQRSMNSEYGNWYKKWN